MSSSANRSPLSKVQIDCVLNGLSHVDRAYIPPLQSKPFLLLALLVLYSRIEKDVALSMLGDDPRWPLQQLRSKRYGYWNISNIGAKKGIYVLDRRHLSGNLDSDSETRFEAKLLLTDKSYRQCLREQNRLGRAFQAYCEVRSNQLSLDI